MDSPQDGAKPLFDEDIFNDSVLRQIKELQHTESGRFPVEHNVLALKDTGLLLRIIIETCLESYKISEAECDFHLMENLELATELGRVYKTGSFADIVYDDKMPAEVVRFAKYNPRGGLQANSNHETLKSAFKSPYVGNAHELLIKTLNRELEARSERPYNLSVAVIQSSGMGKSRMMKEVGNEVFTIQINLRDDLPAHETNVPFRTYFEDRWGKSDNEQQADYAVLLRVLCDKLVELIESRFQGQTGKELAQNFAKHMNKGSTQKAVGPNKKQLFEDVVRAAITLRGGEDKDTTLDELIALMKESCRNLVNAVRPDPLTDTVACIVCFDGAHTLGQVVEPLPSLAQGTPSGESHLPTLLAGKPKHSAYDNLGKVFSYLVEQPMFFTFLSTNPRLCDPAPAPTHLPSTRATSSLPLIPPFTSLPFDIFVDQVLASPEQFTPANLCTTRVMVAFGRALWHTRYESDPDTSIFNFAMDKLTCDEAPEHKLDSDMAALGVRIGVRLDTTTLAGRDLDSRLVESHMRIVYSIPQRGEYMRTGSSSEPILAEAAAQYLNVEPIPGGLRGIARLAPWILAEAYAGGFIARREWGGLIARLLVTIAHDMAAQKHYDATPKFDREAYGQPQYHCPIPLLEFLRALFQPKYYAQVLKATPVCQERSNKSRQKTLGKAFAESYVSFSHFALAGDSGMLAGPCLTTAFARGMGIQAMDGQRSIDAVIPVHMGSPTTTISVQRTSAINIRVKNRKDVRNCPVDRTTTIPNTSQPVISIIFELGCEEPGVQVNHRPHTDEEDPHQNDLHYEIVVYGHSSMVFGVIPPEEEHTYRAILEAGRSAGNLPRRNDWIGDLEAFHSLEPAFYSHQQLQQFAGLIEGVEALEEEPEEERLRKVMEPPQEGLQTRRQSKASGVLKKNRQPEAQKSQPGPAKKRQKR
ncbi:hypothetical protein FS749_008281 [Ceratobasidium sp. UAMH 11750]|nr:hypothetical protein FS749_008281 [Ceratobasidium sp. UAMH 11750]